MICWLKNYPLVGALGAQSIKLPTLDFTSGHDLMDCGIKPCFGLCADRMGSAWDLSPLSLPLPRPTRVLSLTFIFIKKKFFF